jgi:hypothetical protein
MVGERGERLAALRRSFDARERSQKPRPAL